MNKKNGNKKPIWKKWWFWVIVVVAIIGISTGNSSTNSEDSSTKEESETVIEDTEPTTESETQTEEKEIETNKQETEEKETETNEAETEEEAASVQAEEPAKETTEHREGMYGISDKNIEDVDAHFSVSNARNDVTGRWRISTIAEPILIEEYALSYYENYFSDDNEVHVIVNFTYNTSTTITCLGSMLDVTIHEYVDKEEHDAKKMSSGMVLGEYYIYLDNGDIEQIQ